MTRYTCLPQLMKWNWSKT